MGHTVRGSNPIIGLDRPLWLQEVEAPRICRHSSHEGGKVVSRTHWSPSLLQPPPPKEISLVLISIRGWVGIRTIVRPEGFSLGSSRIEPATFRLAERFLKQLLHHAPQKTSKLKIFFVFPKDSVHWRKLKGGGCKRVPIPLQYFFYIQ